MPQTPKPSLIARLAFVLGGVATLSMVGFLLWAGFTAPLNSRMPVPSRDGKYFAYFHPGEEGDDVRPADQELIVSKSQGHLLARLRIRVGRIIWSNANHLVVVDATAGQATLIANADERFVVLARIALNPDTEPRWAPDGNKLAYVRMSAAGLQLAIYDIQQPQAFPVPLPEDYRLKQPRLISWSSGGEYLYLLNVEGEESVLQVVEVRAGSVGTLARGLPSPVQKLPQISPDGSRIFLAQPLNAVIDAQTGATLWVLPPSALALWWAWSADGHELYWIRQEDPAEILAHNFVSSTDQVVVSGVKSNGFFAPDGRMYFFRESSLPPQAADMDLRDWRKEFWGWHQADRLTPSAQALGRVELWPWEQTQDGLILARQDAYTSVRFGLYDPEARILETYVFPTDREDLRSQVRSRRLALTTVALFTLLAAVVLAKRPESKPARAFYIVSFLITALVCGNLVGNSILPSGSSGFPYQMTMEEVAGLGWWMSSFLPQLVFDRVRLTIAGLWALLPPAMLNFGFAFPEGNQFLDRKKPLRQMLYGVAFLPALAMGLGRFVPGFPQSVPRGLLLISGAVVTVVWALSLGANFRRSPDKRSREQVRWLIAASTLLATGTLAFLLLRYCETKVASAGWRHLLHIVRSTLLVLAGWLAPSAIAYAVAARKPSSLRRFLPRLLRQFLMGVPAILIFLVVWLGTGLVLSGALWVFSAPAIMVAVLLTVVAVLPFRGRLRLAIDRTLDRARHESREKLIIFARSLPHTVDRETLAIQLEEQLAEGMRARWNLLFVIDRKARRLRVQPGKVTLPSDIRNITFDLAEPLCEFLMRDDRPFEPSVVSADQDSGAVMSSGGELLHKLQAEAVVGLRRNELVGLLVMGPKATGELYDSEELATLGTIAREAAAAIENIELFEAAARDREMRKELEDAAEIQAKLFPTYIPRLRSGQLAGCCFPARSTSGDYYDFLELPGHRVALAMSDVAGRGMAASLLMASVESLLRAHASTAENLAELVQKINRQLYGAPSEAKSCTLFYGVYDDRSRRLEYVNAGHYPPLVLTAEAAHFLPSTGLPLGLFPEITHQVSSEVLEPGAILLIYSDGVVETRNARGDSFGRDRLASAVARVREADAERALARVVAEVRDFESETLLEDDQTLLLLKVNPE